MFLNFCRFTARMSFIIALCSFTLRTVPTNGFNIKYSLRHSQALCDFTIKKCSFSMSLTEFSWKNCKRVLAASLLLPALLMSPLNSYADDELANYASQGNKVGVDGLCFFRRCALETSKCANDPNCLKGLSCLSRCKGASLCSTGCFAKYGSSNLDDLLYCSVEKNDCVHVPRPAEISGWTKDSLADLPGPPLSSFQPASLRGSWYKIMGLDSRYDCFDCQKNSFNVVIKGKGSKLRKTSLDNIQVDHMNTMAVVSSDTGDEDENTEMQSSTPSPAASKKKLEMKALFRIPRPTYPGYLQSSIQEELEVPDARSGSISHLQSRGKMFGLTFWENWYVLGEHNINTLPKDKRMQIQSNPSRTSDTDVLPRAYASTAYDISEEDVVSGAGGAAAAPTWTKEVFRQDQEPDLKLIFYTGHTLQGNYKGAFVYSRTPTVTPKVMAAANTMIRKSGLSPRDFCLVRNQCFKDENSPDTATTATATAQVRPGSDKYTNNFNLEANLEAKKPSKAPFWYIGQRFFQDSELIAKELADWFQDPMILSDWLVNQQQRMILRQPFAVSPFASLPEDYQQDF